MNGLTTVLNVRRDTRLTGKTLTLTGTVRSAILRFLIVIFVMMMELVDNVQRDILLLMIGLLVLRLMRIV